MISAVRQILAKLDKTQCEWETLQYQEFGKGVTLHPSEPGTAIKISVDERRLIDDKSLRCDCLYFYQKSQIRYAFLVELKGNNYQHALMQLAATFAHKHCIALMDAAKPAKGKIFAVAIVSKKANINRPRKEEWENENKLRLRPIPLADDKTFDLAELIK